MNDDGTQPVEPEWIRAAMRVTWDELRSYLRTLCEVALRPRRFGAAWLSGSAPALNPLGFLATTLVVVAPAVAWFQHPFLKGGDPDSLVFQGFEAAEPFVSLVLMGLVAHPILRLAGSKRRLRSTLAMALYAGAIPNLCLIPLSLSVRGFIGDVETTHRVARAWLYIVPGFTLLFLGAVLVTFAAILRGLHGSSRLLVVVVVAFAFVVTSWAEEHMIKPGLEQTFHVEFPRWESPDLRSQLRAKKR